MSNETQEDDEAFTLPDALVPVLEATLDALRDAGTDANEVRKKAKEVADLFELLDPRGSNCDATVIVGALVTVLWTTLKASEAAPEPLWMRNSTKRVPE